MVKVLCFLKETGCLPLLLGSHHRVQNHLIRITISMAVNTQKIHSPGLISHGIVSDHTVSSNQNNNEYGSQHLGNTFPCHLISWNSTVCSKVSCTALKIERHLLLKRKAMTNLDSILKSRDITLPKTTCTSQSYDFSSSHVWMSELDHKES